MNTKGLARHYDGLTPRERLPLIMAASARGDDAEWDRLVRSAPKVTYRLPDYHGLSEAFRDLSDYYFAYLLAVAGQYFEAVALADAWDEDLGGRMFDVARLLAFLLKTHLAGWRAFCAGLHLDPERLWSGLPGLDMVKRAEARVEGVTFTPEEVAAYLLKKGRDDTEVATEADIATGLQGVLKERTDWWG